MALFPRPLPGRLVLLKLWKWCASQKAKSWRLVPCGHRTKLGIGMPPARYDMAIDVSGLNQIAYYDPGDLTLSVDAGMNWRNWPMRLASKINSFHLLSLFWKSARRGERLLPKGGFRAAARVRFGSRFFAWG